MSICYLKITIDLLTLSLTVKAPCRCMMKQTPPSNNSPHYSLSYQIW